MYIAKIRGDYCTACAANKHAPTDWPVIFKWSGSAECFAGARPPRAKRHQWGLCPRRITSHKLLLKLRRQTATVKDSPIARGWGTSSVHLSSWLTVASFRPAIAIRAPSQTACCDLLLFVPRTRPCQSGVRCSAEGQRFTVLERR